MFLFDFWNFFLKLKKLYCGDHNVGDAGDDEDDVDATEVMHT